VRDVSLGRGDHVSKATTADTGSQAIGQAIVEADVSRSIYHAPLDPDCPEVRRFHESRGAGEDARFLWRGPDHIEDFERRHRAACERCHVYGAVHMEVREAQ
jgi:hypothetical protein